MVAETDFLMRQAQPLGREALEENELLRRAVIYSLTILGEAANHLSADFRANHADIPWRKIIGTRHRVIHEYFGIDYDIVWQIVNIQIPNLHERLLRSLNS